MKKYALLTLTVLFASMFFLPSVVTVAENYDGSEQPTSDNGTYIDAGNLRFYVLTGALNVTVTAHPNHLDDEVYEIPSTVEDENGTIYNVIGIDNAGFFACKNIKTIEIPLSIKKIPEDVFNQMLFCQTDGRAIPSDQYSELLPGSTYSGDDHVLTRQPITVSFDAEGGSILEPMQVGHNEPYGNLPTPVKEGRTFIAWFTEKEGGVEITPNTVCSDTEDHTLFAHWGFVIKLDANGGQVSPDIMIAQENTAIGELPTPTKDGYKFVGWFDAKEGGKPIDETSVFDADTTIYAHWEDAPVPPTTQVTITFDTDGGSECTPITIEQGAAIGELPTPTKDGFNFVGWFTDDGVKVDENTTFTENCTLHAHWEPVPAPSDYTWIIVCVIVLIILIFGGAILYCQYK